MGGIANGVALMVAIDLISTSAVHTVHRTVDAVAGPAQLEVTAGIGEIGFSESVVAAVAALPEVAAAIPLVHATAVLARDPREALNLFEADLTNDSDRHPAIHHPGFWPPPGRTSRRSALSRCSPRYATARTETLLKRNVFASRRLRSSAPVRENAASCSAFSAR